jgi:UDP-glucose 4-epimerase
MLEASMAERPPLAGKSVLVTGGAGFIGSHLVDRLIEDGPSRVTVVDNLFLGREENLAEARARFDGVRFIDQDATDYDAMAAILGEQAVDVVYNLAVVPLPASLTRPRWSTEHTIELVTVPCELLREERYATLIHFSSSEAYGSAEYVPMDEKHPSTPSTPYAAAKDAGDRIVLSYVHTFGVDAAILRPFNNYGPRQNSGTYAGIIPIVVGRARAGQSIEIYGDGLQTRDYVFVRDTAEAAVRTYGAAGTRGRSMNVASGIEVTINELVRQLLEVLGSDVPVRHVEPRLGDVRRHAADIGLARRLIGFEPATSLHDGLAETVEWYLAGARDTA